MDAPASIRIGIGDTKQVNIDIYFQSLNFSGQFFECPIGYRCGEGVDKFVT